VVVDENGTGGAVEVLAAAVVDTPAGTETGAVDTGPAPVTGPRTPAGPSDPDAAVAPATVPANPANTTSAAPASAVTLDRRGDTATVMVDRWA
jgi:hypothetical protein